MQVLKKLRQQSKKTLREIEEATGLSNAYLSQLESGKVKNPSAKHLYILSKVYSVTIEELLVDEDYFNGREIKTFEMLPSIEERLSVIERKINSLENKNILFKTTLLNI